MLEEILAALKVVVAKIFNGFFGHAMLAQLVLHLTNPRINEED